MKSTPTIRLVLGCAVMLALTGIALGQQKVQTTTVADSKYGQGGALETTSGDKAKLEKEVWKDKAGNVREVHEYKNIGKTEVAPTEVWKFYKVGGYPQQPNLTIAFFEKHGIFASNNSYIPGGVEKSKVEEWVAKVEKQFAEDGTIAEPWNEVQTTVEQPTLENKTLINQPTNKTAGTNANEKPQVKPEESKKTEQPKEEEAPKKEETPKTDKASTGEGGGNTASTNTNFTAPGYTAAAKTEFNLMRVNFTAPEGRLTFNLPGDLLPRSPFTGSTYFEPAGTTDAERAMNREALNRYLFRLGEVPLRPVEPSGIPADAGLSLLNIGTNVIIPSDLGPSLPQYKEGTLLVPVGDASVTIGDKTVARIPLPNPVAPTPLPTSFTTPTGGQQGSFITLPGPFDGRISDTDFTKIGDAFAPTIAESQHSRVVWNKSKTGGKIEVSENGRTGTCPFHNVSVNLSTNAPLHLLRGQHANVTVTFSGLGRLNQDVPYWLVNHSPMVVHMQGGQESQNRMIPAGKVVDPTGAKGGTYTDTVSITGVAPGSFVITATVRWKETCNLPIEAMHKNIVP